MDWREVGVESEGQELAELIEFFYSHPWVPLLALFLAALAAIITR